MKSNSQAADKPKLDRAETTLAKIPIRLIKADPKKLGMRDAADYKAPDIRTLADDIKAHGNLNTPVLVAKRSDGSYELLDGFRRYNAMLQLIETGVAGFDEDLCIPAHILQEGASEKAKIACAVSANVMRKSYIPEDILRAVMAMHRAGFSQAESAKHLRISEMTASRYITLGSQPKMMDLVEDRVITSTAAITLLAAADKANRVDELIDAVSDFGRQRTKQIAAETRRRQKADDKPLTEAERFPRYYLTAEQTQQWRLDLAGGTELGAPRFRFKAGVEGEPGQERVRIDSIDKSVAELSTEALEKIAQRCVKLAATLAPVIHQRQESEDRKATNLPDAESPQAGKILAELGLSEEGESDEADAVEIADSFQGTSDNEPAADETEEPIAEEADGPAAEAPKGAKKRAARSKSKKPKAK